MKNLKSIACAATLVLAVSGATIGEDRNHLDHQNRYHLDHQNGHHLDHRKQVPSRPPEQAPSRQQPPARFQQLEPASSQLTPDLGSWTFFLSVYAAGRKRSI